jgi:hypothetical protein
MIILLLNLLLAQRYLIQKKNLNQSVVIHHDELMDSRVIFIDEHGILIQKQIVV